MQHCGAISGRDWMDGSPYGVRYRVGYRVGYRPPYGSISINITGLLAFMETSVINIKHTFLFLTIPR